MKVILIICIIVILLAIIMFIKNNKIPDNLGVHNGKLADMPSKPNAVSSQTDIIEKKVESLKFKGDLDSSKTLIIETIKEFKNVNIVKNEENYIYVVFFTEKMKYKDDVEFYFDQQRKVIHFRSASRVGYSDMGVNRQRYNDIREIYESKKN